MIKFFRRIRQNLLNEGKTSRYLKYAIGEIVLVVIGILIALQINTWNESYKNKVSESMYLNEMMEDFGINLERSNRLIKRINELIPALIGLLEQSVMEKQTITIDSLNNAFALVGSMPTYTSTDRVYNNLIGSGDFKLISNSELKTALASYYKVLDLLNLVQSSHEMIHVQTFSPYIIDNLDYTALKNRSFGHKLPKPVDKNIILNVVKSLKFRNIITAKIRVLSDLQERYMEIQVINDHIIQLLRSR
jgi:hypothetical protein